MTKKQLVNNWLQEYETHTFIKPRVLDANKGNNYRVFNSPSKIVITNFETIVSEQERLHLFLKCRSVGIIIDESAKLKNPETTVTKTFFALSSEFKKKIIMTGTPVANRPYDIWAQIYFLDNGVTLGADFEAFKKNTDLTNKLGQDIYARKEFENEVGSIFDRISDFTVRETKESTGIELPRKKYETRVANFEEHQKMMYQKLKRDLSLEITVDGDRVVDDDSESLKRLLRFNQIASNPKLVDESYKYISGKERVLRDLVEEIISKGEKCIVWSSYIENIEQFTNTFSNYGARKIHGRMSIEERNKSVDLFKKDEECRLLFATPQAAKEGLTLTVANNAIFYDRTFNLDDYLQAQDRIHRISQKKECTIYNIVIEDGIDKWIDSLLYAKQYAAFLAQGDIAIEEYALVADYSYGEIIKDILKEESDG